MTNRIRTVTVLLDRDYRDDDVEAVLNGIQMIKGVAKVEPGDAVDMDDYLNRQQYATEVGLIISALAVNPDEEFLRQVRASHALLKERRRY